MSWCKTEAPAQVNRGLCKWRHLPIRWTVEEVPQEFDAREYSDIVKTAFAMWEAASGLVTEQVDRNPNIVFLARRLDGKNGVLAEAQLPCGNVNRNTQLWCRVDVGEDWRNYKGPLHSGFMDILRVLAHEIGHNLGISHEQSGIPALMDPQVSNIRNLQQWDIQQAVARYGPKKAWMDEGGGAREMDLTPLIECLQGLGMDAGTSDALNFGWEAFKRRMSQNASSYTTATSTTDSDSHDSSST